MYVFAKDAVDLEVLKVGFHPPADALPAAFGGAQTRSASLSCMSGWPYVSVSRGSTGEVVELNADGLTIGREASDFIINDPRVSRRHLRLVLHGETVFACNESTNGTKLNGIRMARGEAVALGCSCAFFVGHLI